MGNQHRPLDAAGRRRFDREPFPFPAGLGGGTRAGDLFPQQLRAFPAAYGLEQALRKGHPQALQKLPQGSEKNPP